MKAKLVTDPLSALIYVIKLLANSAPVPILMTPEERSKDNRLFLS